MSDYSSTLNITDNSKQDTSSTVNRKNSTMFNNQNVSNQNEDYNFYNTDSVQKFVMNWSPPEENKYFSNHRFASPRVLSKSVPRRNRSLMRYKTNRSLNFDIGGRKQDNTYRSPSSSSDGSCNDGDRHLTRSAKIMRALNFNCSPLHNQTKKIKKSLNFDLSVSPTKSVSRSPRDLSNLSLKTPSPRLNKILNFDTSPTDSTASSILITSSESIDENQNQTPSQRNRSAKKSLNYPTPESKKMHRSPDIFVTSPLLRTGLKEKIDNIIHISGTPNIYSMKRSNKKIKHTDEVTISTPRNLFNDFCDDDGDRPSTPENMIRIIPESMSAIKKSHKKERLARRIEHSKILQTELHTEGIEAFTNDSMELTQDRKRPSTPPMNDKYRSPSYNVNSIKQSHKKDKTKKKLVIQNSEDELSDTGSIFDYCTEQDDVSNNGNISNAYNSTRSDIESSNELNNSTPEDTECFSNSRNYMPEGVKNDEIENREISQALSQNQDRDTNLEERDDAVGSKNVVVVTPPRISAAIDRPVTPEMCQTPRDSGTVVTPENRVNYLQRVLVESIKKSHKKLKDENKKKIFKPKNLHRNMKDEQAEIVERCTQSSTSDTDSAVPVIVIQSNGFPSEAENRASTPENVNSSRLLLSQYSSVKKSHKKDKHSKILYEFRKRQKYLNKEVESSKDKESSESSNNNDSIKDSTSQNDMDVTAPSEDEYCTPPDFSNDKVKPSVAKGTPCTKLSPSKRKKLSDESAQSKELTSRLSLDSESCSVEYESADEEFKIFTPIKKRRSVHGQWGNGCSSLHDISASNDEVPNESASNVAPSICTTPVFKHDESLQAEKETENSSLEPVESNEINTSSSDLCDSSLEEINGRSTPKNMSTAELLSQMNSIKKSHKKDKRGNTMRRPLIMEEEQSYCTETVNKITEKHLCTLDSSQEEDTHRHDSEPSTSMADVCETVKNTRDNYDEPLNTTPPNCLKVKTYMRLLQTTSIKRSHKKVRTKKKYNLTSSNPELSDDGSIFGDEDRTDSADELKIMHDANDAEDKGKKSWACTRDGATATPVLSLDVNSQNEMQQSACQDPCSIIKNLSTHDLYSEGNESAEGVDNKIEKRTSPDTDIIRGFANVDMLQQ